MKCEEAKELLIDYLEDTLPVALQEQVESALKNCPECQQELKELRQTMDWVTEAEEKQPPISLAFHFQDTLEKAKKSEARDNVVTLKPTRNYQWTIAASIALIAGIFLGRQIDSTSSIENGSTELTALQEEMSELRTLFANSLMKQSSASERIRGINISYELASENSSVIETLIETMQNDPNINVRVAAAQALFRFGDQESVRAAFIAALSNQKDPTLQILLIDMLVQLEEQRALGELQNIAEQDSTLDIVKSKAQEGISKLI